MSEEHKQDIQISEIKVEKKRNELIDYLHGWRPANPNIPWSKEHPTVKEILEKRRKGL
jgi:hypothetical protein